MFERVKQSIDHLLREQRDYVPVNLLMSEGILLYADYEAWRCGRIRRLTPKLTTAIDAAAELLECAEQCAMQRGLEPYVNDYRGWDAAAGKHLCFSDNAKLERYLRTQYRRAQARPQMDLFADSEENYLINGVIEALCQRLPEKAMELLDDLRRVASDQSAITALKLLAKAQAGLSSRVLSARQALQDLEESVAPVADQWLGSASRDFLVPFWRRLSEGLAGRPFDARQAKLHPSYTLTKAQDWASVRAAVQAEKDWQTQPVLLGRHALSCAALRQEPESLQNWFRLSWLFPDEVAPQIASLAEYAVKRSWQRFGELEPELRATEFPAWMLLHRVGLARSLPREVPGVEGDGHVVYRTVHDLIVAPGQDRDLLSKKVIDLRAQLKWQSPHLFVHYMQQFAAQ